MIRTVRADSALYDLPPERTGRKGRPAGHGKQLLFFLIKRLTVILSPSARSLQICLAAGRYWHMSLPRNRKVEKKTFFQYGFSGTAADFLCLAVEGTHEPDRQYMDEIYSVVLLWIPVEHRNQLLWTENVLVAVQLHGKKPERNRTDGKPEQYRILCHEHFVISGNRYFGPVSWKTVENGIKSQHILRALKQLIYRQEYHL